MKNGIFEPNVVFFVSVIHSGSFYTKKIYTKGTDATFFCDRDAYLIVVLYGTLQSIRKGHQMLSFCRCSRCSFLKSCQSEKSCHIYLFFHLFWIHQSSKFGQEKWLVKNFFSPEQPKCSILEGEEDYCARIFECVDFVGATGPDTYTQMLELRNHLLKPRLFNHFSTHSLVIFDTHFRPNFAAAFSTIRKMAWVW